MKKNNLKLLIFKYNKEVIICNKRLYFMIL